MASPTSKGEGKGTMDDFQVSLTQPVVVNMQLTGSLLEDYQPLVIPSRLSMLLPGHTANVKCVDYLGPESSLAVSGSRYVHLSWLR